MTDSEIDAYAEQLYKAMKGAGTDEDTIIKVTSQNPLSIRLKIRSRYKALYGQDLLEDFKSDLSGNFLKVEEGLYKNIYEYDADECYLAIKGLGTNEDTLIEIIGTRPPWMLEKIKEIYKIKYNIELEKDVIDDTSGDFQKLLVALLQCTRSDNKNPDIEKCAEIAKDLFKGDKEKNKIGIDKDKYIKYFAQLSPCELMHLAREFHREYGKSLIEVIKKELGGDIQKLVITIFYANINPSEYFATRIREAVKGVGTKEKILNRVIITRNEVDMDVIKKYYKTLYSRDLVEDVKSDTSGDYRKLVIALIDK
jgi:hypothetical protein